MCLINFLRQSRSNGKGRSDWKGFSTTIKRQASQPGSLVSRKDGGLIIFTAVFIVMWMAVNALVWGVNCGTQSMALRNCAGGGHSAQGATGSGVSPRCSPPSWYKAQDHSGQSFFVACHYKQLQGSLLASWQEDSSLICQLTVGPPSRGHRWGCSVMESHLSKEGLWH